MVGWIVLPFLLERPGIELDIFVTSQARKNPLSNLLAKELLHAISQFVVMFTAQVWYFRMKGRDASFWSQFSGYDMLYGYLYAITYHLGSLLYGSFLCTLFRVARMLAAMLVRASEDTGHEGSKSKSWFFCLCLSVLVFDTVSVCVGKTCVFILSWILLTPLFIDMAFLLRSAGHVIKVDWQT